MLPSQYAVFNAFSLFRAVLFEILPSCPVDWTNCCEALQSNRSFTADVVQGKAVVQPVSVPYFIPSDEVYFIFIP